MTYLSPPPLSHIAPPPRDRASFKNQDRRPYETGASCNASPFGVAVFSAFPVFYAMICQIFFLRNAGRNAVNPKIFYGYKLVVASFVIMTVAWGANRTFGIFLDPMVREFGWTRAGFSGVFTLGMIQLGLISLLAGRLTDQIGPRALLIACSLFLGGGYALSSQVQSLWHLYLSYGFLTGIGMSGAWAPIMSVVTRWFFKNRSLMSGLIAAGPAIGIAVFPPFFTVLLDLFGGVFLSSFWEGLAFSPFSWVLFF